jgi:hypothetical protein
VRDTTIVNVALPHISGAMSASYDEATWTLTAYLVANGMVLPISAFLSKLLGRKRYFLICITDNLTWRWVFLINVPIGVIATIAVMQFVEDPPWEQKKDRKELGLDYIGIGLIALGLGCLQVFLDRGEDDDRFKSGFITTFAVLSAIGIVGAIFWLLYAKKPVVDLRVLKDRNFALGSVCMTGFATILYGSAVLVTQLARQQQGYTATLAELASSPGAMMIVAIIPVVSKLMPIIQTRYLVGFGFFDGVCVVLYTSPGAEHRLQDADHHAKFAIHRHCVPVRAHHTGLSDAEGIGECGHFRVVHDVPQRGGVDWNFACHYLDCRARAGEHAAHGRAYDAVELQYRSTVLKALHDVDNALVSYRTDQDRREALTRTVEANRISLQLATDSYRKGLVTFITVLDAERQLAGTRATTGAVDGERDDGSDRCI